MSESLDDPHFQEPVESNSNLQNALIVFGLLLLQGYLFDRFSTVGDNEWGIVVVFVILPFLVVYFLLPVFILALIQILLYWLTSLPFLEKGKGWSLRFYHWQHKCTYWVVLISCQIGICCCLAYPLITS